MIKKFTVILFFLLFIHSQSFAKTVENPIFGSTHLLPSPYTLPAGKVILGSTSALGITDFLQVETNLISDFYQIYNGRARLSLLDYPQFAAGIYLGYQYVNLKKLSNSNPDIQLNSWLPGAVIGIELIPQLALFLGGNLDFSSPKNSVTGVTRSGFLQGTQLESDISWAYNPHKKDIGNTLSAGITYNLTYSIYGVGISHHWKGFHLGAHYYPNATTLKVLPLISGGAIFDI